MTGRTPEPLPRIRLASPDFIWPVRVYYEDTDAGGVVYYANYLKFMERARTEWLRSLGFELPALAQQHAVIFVVRGLSIEYLLPARFNDELEIAVELTHARGSLIEIAQQVCLGKHVLLTGAVALACVNTHTFRPVRMPGPVAEKITKRQA